MVLPLKGLAVLDIQDGQHMVSLLRIMHILMQVMMEMLWLFIMVLLKTIRN